MKATSESLSDFISDFKLQDTNETVCFIANIEFESATAFKKLDTAIQIITVAKTGTSVFYLLDKSILEHQIPDYLLYSDTQFTYVPKEYLEINQAESIYGSFTLRIIPIQRECNPVLEQQQSAHL